MHSARLRVPSPALVISVVALLLALGGTSYAAFSIPKNSVGSKQLKKNAVTTSKIANHAVTGAKLKLGTIGTVPSAKHAATATTASTATTATTAGNALTLGGAKSSAFLRSTITIVSSGPTVAPSNFQAWIVKCPAGYQAIGGGVSPQNVLTMVVTESSPTVGGSDIALLSDGQHPAADGWEGAVRNNDVTNKTFKVGVTCSRTA